MFSRSLVLLLLVGVPVFSQEKKDPIPTGEAEKKFDTVLRGIEKTLRDTKSWSLQAETSWKTTGSGKDRSGKNIASLSIANPDRARLELFPSDKPTQNFLIVADGKQITRFFPAKGIYTQTALAGLYEDLQNDPLTLQSLQGSGIDFLVRSDLRGTILAQTIRVEDLGTKEIGGKKLAIWKIIHLNGHEMELRLSEGAKPLPVEVITTRSIPIDDKKSFQFVTESKLTWELDAKTTPETFSAALPKEARKVEDLMTALLEGEVTQLIGKPAPAMKFTSLDGKEVSPADQKGKTIVVLYFWATWATSSSTNMPSRNKFVKDYTDKGVTFLSVNVGDKPELAKEFVEKQKFDGTVVLDAKAEVFTALKTNILPAIIIIDKAGVVHSFHRGARPETRAEVQAELDLLLKGAEPKK